MIKGKCRVGILSLLKVIKRDRILFEKVYGEGGDVISLYENLLGEIEDNLNKIYREALGK